MLDRSTTERLAAIYEGLPVLGLLPGSPAAVAGVKPGDIVLEVNGLRTRDLDSYVAAKGWRNGVMIVKVVRAGAELELTLVESKSHIPTDANALAALVLESGAAGFVAAETTKPASLLN